GLVLSVDRMERSGDSGISAVQAVEDEFGFPVLSIANVREIFEAASHITSSDGKPFLSIELQAQAERYLDTYGSR
ncbi:MAG: orotate phosphoribosyltransferase, partial [Bifidobacterium crudilactis]|nr:orotate phosphoribosyltransferase [Bifidobacterium crudilactis]